MSQKRNSVTKSALSLAVAALALGVSTNSIAAPSWAKKGDEIEKCAGIAKKGMNDCDAKGHDCSGKAKIDNSPDEWVYLPAGACEKIAGGNVIAKKKAE